MGVNSLYKEKFKSEINTSLKTFYDFIDFNANLFEEKLAELGSEKLAKNYIEKISIAEYIEEIRERI